MPLPSVLCVAAEFVPLATTGEIIMKKVVIALVVLVVVLGVVVWRLYVNLDVIVAKLIEEAGTEVTQTSVAVKGVELHLLDGQAAVSGLAVANPAGFSSPDIFKLEKIALSIDVESLKGSPIVINELVVAQPQVFYEMNKEGVSNLSVLKKNVESHSATQAPSSGEQAPAGEPVKLVIRKLRFEGGHLSATSALAPERKLDTDLPAFQLTNIGQSTGGASGAQIARELLDGLIRQATEAAGRAGADKLKGELQQKATQAIDEKLGDKLKGVLGK
jgi:uncharacterized protein involved in outer membrane biogenesis